MACRNKDSPALMMLFKMGLVRRNGSGKVSLCGTIGLTGREQQNTEAGRGTFRHRKAEIGRAQGRDQAASPEGGEEGHSENGDCEAEGVGAPDQAG